MANNHTQEVAIIEESINERSQYKYAAWLIDVTGWRLIDEIFHIMAYMPNKQFSNYILPLCNINSFIQRQYNIKVVTQMSGRRVLKDLENNEIIDSKSENCGLIEFISWLEENRGNSSGIILLTYERNEKMAVALLAALERNELLERFMNVVKGFANVYHITKSLCPNFKTYSFVAVTKSLLNKEPEWHQLTKICYDLLIKLVQVSTEGSDNSEDLDSRTLYYIKNVMKSSAEQKEELDHLLSVLNKQNTWRPLFRDAMRSNRRNRGLSTKLRKCLVDKHVDFDKLQAEYENGGKDSVVTLLANLKIDDADSRSIAELVDCYFNSEQRIVVPKVWPMANYRRVVPKPSNRKVDRRNSNDFDTTTAESTEETETEIVPL